VINFVSNVWDLRIKIWVRHSPQVAAGWCCYGQSGSYWFAKKFNSCGYGSTYLWAFVCVFLLLDINGLLPHSLWNSVCSCESLVMELFIRSRFLLSVSADARNRVFNKIRGMSPIHWKPLHDLRECGETSSCFIRNIFMISKSSWNSLILLKKLYLSWLCQLAYVIPTWLFELQAGTPTFGLHSFLQLWAPRTLYPKKGTVVFEFLFIFCSQSH